MLRNILESLILINLLFENNSLQKITIYLLNTFVNDSNNNLSTCVKCCEIETKIYTMNFLKVVCHVDHMF